MPIVVKVTVEDGMEHRDVRVGAPDGVHEDGRAVWFVAAPMREEFETYLVPPMELVHEDPYSGVRHYALPVVRTSRVLPR